MARQTIVFLILGALGLGVCAAQEKPLSALPYSPSLDPSSMDRSVDPCVDFYQYSCGGWKKNNPIPSDQSSWDVYGKLTNENEQFLWGILEQASKPDTNRNAVDRQIGDYFAACMNEAAIEKAGLSPVEPRLKEIQRLKSIRDVAGFLGQVHQDLGSNLIFEFGSAQDPGDSSRVIATASASGLGLPDRDYYFKQDARGEETRRKYVEYLTHLFQLLGDPAPEEKARTVMAIETDLAKATLTRVDRRDPYKVYHKVSRKEFVAMAPSFPWDLYWKDRGLAGVHELNVTEPAFYREVNVLLKKRKMDDWKSYLRVHLLNDAAPYLSPQFEQASFDFYQKFLNGVPQMRPRWKRCVRSVDNHLGEALGQAFVAKVFGPEQKQATVDMTKRIEVAMRREIEHLPWMTEETKKRAFEKLDSIVNKVGYPDHWRDYSSIQISRDDFLGNVERTVGFEIKRQLNKIGKPVDRGEWDMTPPTVNAYYNASMNDINFPAGVLQPPLFDSKMDAAPNYGNTGSTIGHELTHGFDDEGRQFDAKGNLHEWWTKQDAAEFEKRAKCVSDQYGEYKVVGDLKINSKLTLGEDIADIGGTLLAYIAWKEETAGMHLQPQDGLTPDQRFFVGMAQWACSNERPESQRERVLLDPHSPPQYRINGVVSNLSQFQQTFSCHEGQPMVRAEACRVW